MALFTHLLVRARMRGRACALLDLRLVCVYVGMKLLVAPFWYLRNNSHSVMFVFLLTRRSHWRTGKTRRRASDGFFFSSPLSVFLEQPNMLEGLGAVFPRRARGDGSSRSDVTIAGFTFFSFSLRKRAYGNFQGDWQMHDVSSTSYTGLERAGDYLPRWCHLFTELIPNT